MFNELHIPDWHRNYNKTVESLEIWHVGILVMVDKEQEGTGKSLIKNDKLPTWVLLEKVVYFRYHL